MAAFGQKRAFFSNLLIEGSINGKIQVRLGGETKPVMANFYANVSELAKRNEHLSKLLDDLRSRLESTAATLRRKL